MQCDADLALWARVYGAVGVTLGSIAIIFGCFSAVVGNKHDLSKVQGMVTSLLGLLGFTASGLFIWGTVLSFSNDRWNRVMIAAPAEGPPCALDLYKPVSIIIIVCWSFGGEFRWHDFVSCAICFFIFVYVLYIHRLRCGVLLPCRLLHWLHWRISKQTFPEAECSRSSACCCFKAPPGLGAW